MISSEDPDAGMCLSCGRYSLESICPWCGHMTELYFWDMDPPSRKGKGRNRRSNRGPVRRQGSVRSDNP